MALDHLRGKIDCMQEALESAGDKVKDYDRSSLDAEAAVKAFKSANGPFLSINDKAKEDLNQGRIASMLKAGQEEGHDLEHLMLAYGQKQIIRCHEMLLHMQDIARNQILIEGGKAEAMRAEVRRLESQLADARAHLKATEEGLASGELVLERDDEGNAVVSRAPKKDSVAARVAEAKARKKATKRKTRTKKAAS